MGEHVLIRDRIKELRRVTASELRPNPKNWRTHPESQKNALRGLLAEIGFAGAELARELPDGTLMLIDGHCRAELAGDSEIPVLVLDVDDDEADKILLSFDSIGAMATANKEQLTALLHEVEFENGYVSELIEELSRTAGLLDEIEESECGDDECDDMYTRKVEAPIYRPTGPKPDICDLFNRENADKLINAIESSDVPDNVKQFLEIAAMRHVVFNYEQIAEFYAHADSQTKKLMEDSVLVIIDFDRAIELGYVQLSKKLAELYGEEYGSQ